MQIIKKITKKKKFIWKQCWIKQKTLNEKSTPVYVKKWVKVKIPNAGNSDENSDSDPSNK